VSNFVPRPQLWFATRPLHAQKRLIFGLGHLFGVSPRGEPHPSTNFVPFVPLLALNFVLALLLLVTVSVPFQSPRFNNFPARGLLTQNVRFLLGL